MGKGQMQLGQVISGDTAAAAVASVLPAGTVQPGAAARAGAPAPVAMKEEPAFATAGGDLPMILKDMDEAQQQQNMQAAASFLQR